MEGVQLAGNPRAGEIRQRGGIRVSAVLLDHDHQIAVIIGVGEIDGELALLGGAHARDDAIDGAGGQGRNQAVPFGLHDLKLAAQNLADALCNAHIVAVGITTARERDRVFAFTGLRPVIGRIVAFHADAQRLGARAGEDEHQDQGNCKQLSHFLFLLCLCPFMVSRRMRACHIKAAAACALRPLE